MEGACVQAKAFEIVTAIIVAELDVLFDLPWLNPGFLVCLLFLFLFYPGFGWEIFGNFDWWLTS